MKTLLTRKAVSMTELKTSPAKVLTEAHGEPVAVFNRNEPVAYLVPASAVEGFETISADGVDKLLDEVLKENAVALDNLKDR